MSQDELRAARVVFSLELSQCDAGEPYDQHAMQRAAIPLARAYLAVVADPTTLPAVKALIWAATAAKEVLSGEAIDEIEPGAPAGAALNLLGSALKTFANLKTTKEPG